MNTQEFSQYAQVIKSFSDADIAAGRFQKLKMDENGNLSVYYTPFEFVNKDAKIMIVGITPGKSQLKNAVVAARDSLKNGDSLEVALEKAKKSAAFSGPLRSNLVKMLDLIGLQKYLGIESCDSLFGADSHLAQTASLLKNAVIEEVIKDGIKKEVNYTGSSGMMKNPMILNQITNNFLKDAQELDQALIMPLGVNSNLGVNYLVEKGLIDPSRVLSGMIHPSGASAERVAYFLGTLGKKPSAKTDGPKIDKVKEALIKRLAA